MKPSRLSAGRVYRTQDLARWGRNPSRLAKQLVRKAVLQPLAHGLFLKPRQGRFGAVPPTDEALLTAFLKGSPFVITGPERWNALGLGATAVFPLRLVYNTRRSGEFTLGGRRFLLRRVGFPLHPTPAWFAIDLIEHRGMAGLSGEALEGALTRAVASGRLEAASLREAASRYGSRATQALVARASGAAG